MKVDMRDFTEESSLFAKSGNKINLDDQEMA